MLGVREGYNGRQFRRPKDGPCFMANKHLWPLVCTLALLAIVCACGGGSSNATPPPPNPDSLYSLTLSRAPPNLSFQLSNLQVDSSTGSFGFPATTPFCSPLVPA